MISRVFVPWPISRIFLCYVNKRKHTFIRNCKKKSSKPFNSFEFSFKVNKSGFRRDRRDKISNLRILKKIVELKGDLHCCNGNKFSRFFWPMNECIHSFGIDFLLLVGRSQGCVANGCTPFEVGSITVVTFQVLVISIKVKFLWD